MNNTQKVELLEREGRRDCVGVFHDLLFRGGSLDKESVPRRPANVLHPIAFASHQLSAIRTREMPQRTFNLKLFARRYLAKNDHPKMALATLTSAIGMTMGLLSLITTLWCSWYLRWDAAQGP